MIYGDIHLTLGRKSVESKRIKSLLRVILKAIIIKPTEVEFSNQKCQTIYFTHKYRFL